MPQGKQEELCSEHHMKHHLGTNSSGAFRVTLGRAGGGEARETYFFEILIILILFPGKTGLRKRDRAFFFTVAGIEATYI